jgi:hypothetical protein
VAETNRPRAEPEIIPPSHADPRWDERMRIDGRNRQRIYVAQVGPFGFAMAALAVAIIAALALLLVLGAFVVLIPLAGLVATCYASLEIVAGRYLRYRPASLIMDIITRSSEGYGRRSNQKACTPDCLSRSAILLRA